MFAEQISDPDLEAPRPTINDSGDESIGGLPRCDGSRGRLELSPRVCTAWLILNRHLDRPYERYIFLRSP